MLKKNANTSLTLHVCRFANTKFHYDPNTLQDGLDKIHGSDTRLKGTLIARFNATHSQPHSQSRCSPKTEGDFTTDTNGSYGRHLHLGTTRIWTADGGIDESRWQQFAEFVTNGQDNQSEKVVFKSTLKKYLAHCLEIDANDLSTGRNASHPCSSKQEQAFAATSAWDEVYDRLTCGWSKTESGEPDPYIDLSLVRLFFEDSEAAFMKAETQELPVPKEISDEEMSVSVFGQGSHLAKKYKSGI